MNGFTKATTTCVWLWAIAGALGMQVPGGQWGLSVFLGLLGAHILEMMMFLPRLKDKPGSMGEHALGILVFGYFYYAQASKAENAN